MQQKYHIELVEEHDAVNFIAFIWKRKNYQSLNVFLRNSRKAVDMMKRLMLSLHGLIKSERMVH